MSNATRLTLIQRVCSNKDEKSWEEFDGIYRNYINGFVAKMGIAYDEVEDISQKILLKIWQKLPEFEYRPGECRFRSWLAIISRTIVKDHRNLIQNKMQTKIDTGEIPESSLDAEVDLLAMKEWKVFISKMAWENISEKFTPEVIDVFRKTTEISVREIAQETGLAENTIYVYKKRVKAALEREIQRLNYELG